MRALMFKSMMKVEVVKIIPSPLHNLAQFVLKEKIVFLSKEKNNWLKLRNNRLFVT